MQFKADPLSVFTRDQSAIAIHARLRWMNGGARDSALGRRVLDRLRRTQADDGSWGGSVAATIEHLFDLWLLGQPDRMTARAIDWLLEVPLEPPRNLCGGVYDGMFFRVLTADRPRLRRLRSLPFTGGCGGFVKTGAALFFATVLGQGSADRVARAYARAEAVGRLRQGRWCSDSCGNNILQAVAAHEQFRPCAWPSSPCPTARTPRGNGPAACRSFPRCWPCPACGSNPPGTRCERRCGGWPAPRARMAPGAARRRHSTPSSCSTPWNGLVISSL